MSTPLPIPVSGRSSRHRVAQQIPGAPLWRFSDVRNIGASMLRQGAPRRRHLPRCDVGTCQYQQLLRRREPKRELRRLWQANDSLSRRALVPAHKPVA